MSTWMQAGVLPSQFTLLRQIRCELNSETYEGRCVCCTASVRRRRNGRPILYVEVQCKANDRCNGVDFMTNSCNSSASVSSIIARFPELSLEGWGMAEQGRAGQRRGRRMQDAPSLLSVLTQRCTKTFGMSVESTGHDSPSTAAQLILILILILLLFK